MLVSAAKETLGNGKNTKTESSSQQAEPPKEEPLLNPCLHKQNSIFSLTLDEIQCKSGMRGFGSMNMEEFIANIWSVEENQVPEAISINNNSNINNIATATLARQGSFSIPIPLCKKTVDEIWFEIHKEESHSHSTDQPREGEGARNDSGPQRQQTLGEMTLEDFLVKAGVVQETVVQVTKSGPSPNSHDQYYYETTTMPVERHVSKKVDTNKYGIAVNVVASPTGESHHFPGNESGSGFAGYDMYGQSSDGNANNSIGSDRVPNVKSPTLTEPSAGKSKRRIIDGPLEVVVERRQRRMIKNRESAARSRARKQAYTVELEVELNQLKDENEKLKQILAETQRKRKREVLMKRKMQLTKAQKLIEKLRKLRRAVSLAW
ncbi:Basic-leucine zipper transcription factor [Parasponia andersonii]|uniref:Basic-leucine zipper transcription factor n=1 Tax=Parasponia andersonii TaxID=3476 RepID=A0A2P5DU58_PARAD|nr:Basic-leucine zipper transcription factor [Parasponia andersonii]